MAELDEFILWCTKERTKLQRQLEAYQSRKMSQHHRSIGAAWIDRTPQEIRRLKKNIADLDAVLMRLKN